MNIGDEGIKDCVKTICSYLSELITLTIIMLKRRLAVVAGAGQKRNDTNKFQQMVLAA